MVCSGRSRGSRTWPASWSGRCPRSWPRAPCCWTAPRPTASPGTAPPWPRATGSSRSRGSGADARFPDDVEQAKLQALSDAIDAGAGYADADHAALEYTALPKGLPASELDPGQREMLRALLATYLDRVPAEVSPLGRYSDDETLDAVHVAWAGPTEPGAPHYYRLQGPRLLIEWDNTQRGANHAHSVWRDPTADFGLDVLAAHRAAHH